MNRIDASDHYDDSSFKGQTPSLLTVIIDTNPRAWAALKSVLPISKAIANILVFINAHLAFGNDNQVAVLAAHTNRAVWLYPPNPGTKGAHHRGHGSSTTTDGDDVKSTSANKYPQFAQIESSILSSLRDLINSTTSTDIGPTTPLIAGALTLALSHINKTSLAFAPSKTTSGSTDPANPTNTTVATATSSSPSEDQPTLHARILVISVSDSAPSQYIPTMNTVFAASHARIPIDTLAIHKTPTFLQQAAYITGGTFLSAAATNHPRGLLSYLMFGFLADAQARLALVNPTQDTVDFRAACFCHRRVIDTGFVCSVCLSIFCEVPQQETEGGGGGGGDGSSSSSVGAECLTCGTKLALGRYGAKPAVVPRRKPKKKKARVNGVSVGPDTGSAVGTPVP
ncbi:putative rna polymerase ii transcription factor b subunit 4 protein [Eutypa lata UCREL1]|uniref:General transcription and DNA repair factor IIH subunit TFB4 n=1 Tax=Eutypa lata (strain UCR-EL1) TaxID=1287681 RepID=M7SQV7_EUTLA|nr:putative rna polymerase ii transcription factor b subunit 4 protein [Eutypa lata UCREL1]